MTNGYNLWLEWEAYKIRHPEERQVLEWQEQYYKMFCGCPQGGNGDTPPGPSVETGKEKKDD